QLLEHFRPPKVVRIQESEELTTRLPHPPVAGDCSLLIRLIYIADPRIRSELPDRFRGSIGRAVIDHQELPIRERLGADTLERGWQPSALIVGGDDDAYGRHERIDGGPVARE